MEEVPGAELALFLLDDEQASPGKHEECLLRVLPVVVAEALTRLEDADVDADVREPPLALEVAVDTEPLRFAPADLARADHEPALAVRHVAVLRESQWGL